MVTVDLSLGRRQAYPILQITTHSDEKVNVIDLNFVSGDVPAIGGRFISQAAESHFMLNCNIQNAHVLHVLCKVSLN